MHPANLPIASMPVNTDMDFLSAFNRHVSIERKKCLCIGYDQEQLERYVKKYHPGEVVILTLWKDHKDAVAGDRVIIGDITETTPFQDNEFDFVLTLSLLEHISDLQKAFDEIKRILKPEGFFISFFGPAWSCHVGHHIYAEPGKILFDFSQWEMPTHIHLLATKDEIKDYYKSRGASEVQCDAIIHWFYETKIINRIFFDDYMKLFSKNFYVVAMDLMYSEIPTAILSELHMRYPGYTDFVTYGGKFLLKNRKPKLSISSKNDMVVVSWTNGFYRLEGTSDNNWRWCDSKGKLEFSNLSKNNFTVTMEMHLSTGYYRKSKLSIDSDLFSVKLKINSRSTHLSKKFILPPGNHILDFETNAPRVKAPGDDRKLHFKVENFDFTVA